MINKTYLFLNNNRVSNNDIIINDAIDETILHIHSAVKKLGFDPVKVPTIRHNIGVVSNQPKKANL